MSKKQVLGIVVSISLLCLVLSSLLLRAQHPLIPNPDFVNALWIAKADGIHKIATADASVLLQISDLKNAHAMAVDEHRGLLWVYTLNTLWAYGFNGKPSFSVSLAPYGASGNGKGVVLSVNHKNGTVWLGAQKSLYHMGSQGQWLSVHSLAEPVQALSWDATTSCLWIGTQKTVTALHDTGTLCKVVDLGPHPDVQTLMVDPASGDLWVAMKKVLQRYDASGVRMLDVEVKNLSYLTADHHGGVWIATDQSLIRMDRTGLVLQNIEPFAEPDKIVALVSDRTDASIWVAGKKKVHHLRSDGHLLQQLDFKGEIRDLALYADTLPPSIAFAAPRDGDSLSTGTPVLDIQYQDSGSGIELETLRLQVDRVVWTVTCQYDETGASCTPTTRLPEGGITLTAAIADFAGNTSEAPEIHINVDTTPPVISLNSLPSSTSTNQSLQTFAGSLSEPSTLTLNGEEVRVEPNLSFSYGPVSLQEGLNIFALVATDAAANSRRLDVQLSLDTLPPMAIDKALIEVDTVADGQIEVRGKAHSVEAGANVIITNTRTGQTVSARATSEGGFAIKIAAQGGDILSIVAVDVAGNASSPSTVEVASALPPDPTSVAPPLDPTVVTDFATATAFLYSGAHPIQTGMVPETIEPRRVSVLRGQVQTRDGAALPGVTITVLGHPEYGQTLTRADGMFDMAVNGGGVLTLRYAKERYLSVQRPVQAPWRDYVWLPDVVMIPYDDRVTTIDLAGAVDVQAARGNPVTDARGTRQATLLFAAGTQAVMALPDGVAQPLPSLHVRATEYTVGPNGKAALPGELPPASAYTYAVELSVDEAVAAGAKSVQFTQPVVMYVDNFLGFPIGSAVPVGYYDWELGLWIASENGQIIRIVGFADGLAEIDTNGDGIADDVPVLEDLGITAAERRSLASLYLSSQSVWRVPITHFTPYDLNWPAVLPEGRDRPTRPQPMPFSRPVDDPDKQCGSIISCQNHTLGEALSIPGTPFHLHYQSDRSPGYIAARTIEISLTDGLWNMTKVFLTIEVAGQRLSREFTPGPNLTYTFTWDGRDGYGREIQGEHPVNVRIGYYHDLCYEPPAPTNPSFALPTSGAGGPGWGMQTCTDLILWQQQRSTVIGYGDSRAGQLGGWTLDAHHTYDLKGKVLQMGDGTRRNVAPLGQAITSVAGQGAGGSSGDGKPAHEAYLNYPQGMVVGPDGSVYIADGANHRIRRIKADNIMTTVAGNGAAGYSGDGGYAAAAQLNYPVDVAIAPDGSLYIADSRNARIRKVDPQGIITTVAGGGSGEQSPDGKLATEVPLTSPFGLAVGPDSSLYIAEFYAHRVRRVGPEGIITTAAGIGSSGFSGDGRPASLARLNNPLGLVVGGNGSLYIADKSNQRIRRVGIDGIITTVAGNGSSGYGGDGGLATQAQLRNIQRIAIGPDGSLYIADANYGYFDRVGGMYVRRVRSDGIITTVAGSAIWGDAGDGGSATQARFGAIEGIAVGPDHRLYISDNYFMRVRRVGPPLPEYSPNDLIIPSEGGNAVYVFDKGGRHLHTSNALTAGLQNQFHYEAAGRLTQIHDGDGKITTIERDGAGNPQAIISPFGQRTILSLNPHGYLSSLTNPAGETTGLTYTSGGLLTSLTDPKGNLYRFSYDAFGRLTRDEDPVGGFKALSLVHNRDSSTTKLTSALGRSTTYLVERPSTGGMRRVNIDPSGLESATEIGIDGSRRVTHANGTVTSLIAGPDPRFGTQAPLAQSFSFTTPSGLTSIIEETRTTSLSSPLDLLKLARATNTLTINGRPYTRTFDAASMTVTDRTPMGRQMTSLLDGRGRVMEQRVAGLEPLRFSYAPAGELVAVAQGARSTLFGYDTQGRLATITDPLGHTIGFEYDAVGRVTRQILPDKREVLSTYDANGNISSLTPPGRPSHAFSYTAVDLEEGYIPPTVGADPSPTLATYNLDHQLVEMSRPDGTKIALGYAGSGRLSTLRFPRGELAFGYHPTTGNLSTITDPDGGMLSYDHDGSLLTRETWSGAIAGNIQYTYDNNFRLSSQSVNGDSSLTFHYDADSLLTRVGALAMHRNAQNGYIAGSTLDNVVDVRTYDNFGELSSYKATFSGHDIFAVHYTRDLLGRITQKNETVEGQSNVYRYKYGVAGHLAEVQRNGSTIATYACDSNGNRVSHISSDGTQTGAYDVQDRLLHFGSTTYSYTANGELQQKTAGNQTTRYEYDALGNLRTVTLPSGSRIEYGIDGRNRRVGKKVNGNLVQGFLYDGDLTPAVELDGNGQVVTRFIYATGRNVPDYMIKGGFTYRIITDHLGSPRLVVDTNTGHVVHRMAYDAYGQIIFDDNPGFQPFGFAGGLYDPDTRLTRFGARDYDAETGRWTAKDPIRFAGGDTNLYSYVLNDPINWVDPTGLVLDTIIDIASIGYDIYRLVRDNIAGNCDNLGTNLGALGADAVGILIPFATGLGTTTRNGKVLIGKMKDLNKPGTLRADERLLDLPDRGTPKLNWEQNASRLREAMREGQPIRDASVDPVTGALRDNTGFLRAERNVLANKGWKYNKNDQHWHSPGH